jgi:hypothetical protein
MACVLMIDSSQHAKARAQACHSCVLCLEKLGLAGLGKKGVLATAKLLSQETAVYRAVALDLMEAILSKMNGDIHRLVKLCGPNLSDKARVLLEERWNRVLTKEHLPSSGRMKSPVRRGQSFSPQKSPSNRNREPEIFDELPRLSLREGGRDIPRASPRLLHSLEDNVDDKFTFTFSTRDMPPPRGSESNKAWSSETDKASSTSSGVEPRGAAAALRARLLKIRDKGKPSDIGDVSSDVTERNPGRVVQESVAVMSIDFGAQMGNIRALLDKNGPVESEDPQLEACVLAVKILHAGVARQENSKVGLSMSQLSEIRVSLGANLDSTVALIRR